LLETVELKKQRKSAEQAQGQRNRKVTGKERKTEMIIPVRCFTCGKLVGDKWEEFTRRIKTGENASDILDSLGVKRYCCRRMLLSNVEIVDEVLRFYEEAEKRKEARSFY
jgi:DNA-directed RNA polymerase subunit N